MPSPLIDLSPAELAECLDAQEVLLIDVREPYEFEAAKIDGAINIPLSVLEHTPLPDPEGKTIVLSCAGGVRTVTAYNICQARGDEATRHLAGGLRAWIAAGFNVV
jgi:rhodanese-related sulfurtransferase